MVADSLVCCTPDPLKGARRKTATCIQLNHKHSMYCLLQSVRMSLRPCIPCERSGRHSCGKAKCLYRFLTNHNCHDYAGVCSIQRTSSVGACRPVLLCHHQDCQLFNQSRPSAIVTWLFDSRKLRLRTAEVKSRGSITSHAPIN